MSDAAAPIAVSEAGAVPDIGKLKKIKIGAVARHFGVSVDLLRLYEREGLLIPLKSEKGTRYFTEPDFPWIATVLRLVRTERLNFAGIRHLLALIPCWELRKCDAEKRHNCSIAGTTTPCWVNQNCCEPQDCYVCEIYRSACQCENLKSFVVNGH
jgi:MerR family transcriptional regulator/heat shock protein HspR